MLRKEINQNNTSWIQRPYNRIISDQACPAHRASGSALFWVKEVLGIGLFNSVFPNPQCGRMCFITPDHRWGKWDPGRVDDLPTMTVPFCIPAHHHPSGLLLLTASSPSPNKGCIVNAGSPHPFGDCKVLQLYLLSLTSGQKPPPCSISWFYKIHEESHVLSSCLKTHLAGTDKSPEIPVLKPELLPCFLGVMEMARLGARWPVSREHRNVLSSIQGLLFLFRLLESNLANEVKHKLGFIFRSCPSS